MRQDLSTQINLECSVVLAPCSTEAYLVPDPLSHRHTQLVFFFALKRPAGKLACAYILDCNMQCFYFVHLFIMKKWLHNKLCESALSPFVLFLKTIIRHRHHFW